MPFLSSSPSSKKFPQAPRWFAGISISGNCRRIESAIIGVHGRGSGAPIEIRKAISFDLPQEITESYAELQRQVSTSPDSTPRRFLSLYYHVRQELASVEEEAIGELLDESRLPKNELLAVGVHDAGLFQQTPTGRFYQSLCDAPSLAEQTGLNIVDAFPALDIAAHGNGGPVLALPTWIFLKSESVDRILVDLGASAKIMFLPRSENVFSHQRVRYQDIVPCGSLLDALTLKLTDGENQIDVGGRLTVQGCQIADLMQGFKNLERPETFWNQSGLSPKPFLDFVGTQNASNHSTQDVLCTASCFIAERIAENVMEMIRDQTPTYASSDFEPEILLTGAGRLHGMLINRIATLLDRRKIATISQFGFPAETFDAVCTAMLTLMSVDQIPSNIPALTGSETGKALGRITPGSTGAWHRLILEMSENKPCSRPLRSAV